MSSHSRNHTTITSLPPEILDIICTYLCGHCSPNTNDIRCLFDGRAALLALSRMSQSLYRAAQPYTVHVCTIYGNKSMSCLLRTLVERPDLACHVAVFQDQREQLPNQYAERCFDFRGGQASQLVSTLRMYTLILSRIPHVRFVLLRQLDGSTLKPESATKQYMHRISAELQLFCHDAKDPLYVDMTDDSMLCRLVPCLRSWETQPWDHASLPPLIMSQSQTQSQSPSNAHAPPQRALRNFHIRHRALSAYKLRALLSQARGSVSKVRWSLRPSLHLPITNRLLHFGHLLECLLPWKDTLEELDVYDFVDDDDLPYNQIFDTSVEEEDNGYDIDNNNPFAKLFVFRRLKILRIAVESNTRSLEYQHHLISVLPPQLESARVMATQSSRNMQPWPLPGLLGSSLYSNVPGWQYSEASLLERSLNDREWSRFMAIFEDEYKSVELVGH